MFSIHLLVSHGPLPTLSAFLKTLKIGTLTISREGGRGAEVCAAPEVHPKLSVAQNEFKVIFQSLIFKKLFEGCGSVVIFT